LRDGFGDDERRTGGSGGGGQLIHRGGAGSMERHKDDAVEDGKENLRHFGDGLVAEATEDERARSVRNAGVAEASTQSPGSGGVVGHIENPVEAVAGDALHAARPTSEAQAFGDGCGRDGELVGVGQLNGRGDGQGKIAMLVGARER